MESGEHRPRGVEAIPGGSAGHARPLLALTLWVVLMGFLPLPARADVIPGEGPTLGQYEERRTLQDQIAGGTLSLHEIRLAGLNIFTTPFNHYDGYGDGVFDPNDPTTPGNRPTLGNNGTMLRINGLDAQTCLDCHNQLSTATRPMTFGVGGAGGINATALFQARNIDVADEEGNGFAFFDGRVINPLSLFGSGGAQLLAKEMTADLLQLKAVAAASPPDTQVDLISKGVSFGYLVSNGNGDVDTEHVEGIEADLIVRPFGRKGEFSSIRAFDLEATRFHLGMQPAEVVGDGIDEDLDGVADELLPGEISALEIFLATMPIPFQEKADGVAQRGFDYFQDIGCAECHRPVLQTDSRYLGFSYPEVPADPGQNLYFRVDLTRAPSRFSQGRKGGIAVELFSDLKRHDMGPELAENFHAADEQRNAEFITAKLWGVADTAPYLHDGRALTLFEAIRLHGGEAESARDGFLSLNEDDQAALLGFLGTLRNPLSPNSDVLDKD